MTKRFLNISEIASYTGYNPYDNITPFERFWKRCDPIDYNKLMNKMNLSLFDSQIQIERIKDTKIQLEDDLKNKKLTKRQFTLKTNEIVKKEKIQDECIKEITEKIDNIKLTKSQQIEKTLGKEILNTINSIDISTESKREQINDIISERVDLNENDKNVLLKKTENVINTTHGILKEDPAILQFEKKFKVKLDTTQVYNSKQFKGIYYIGGKVDGLYIDSSDSTKSYVVEVKNRTKGFFSSLRDYESVQIQLYMWLLNLNQAKLVENYNDKLRITIIYKNDLFINSILEYLSIFITNFENEFLNNIIEKELYINKSQNDKKMFINKLYLSEIQTIKNEKYKQILDENDTCLIDDLD